jgi:diamine N-acetyltransferase
METNLFPPIYYLNMNEFSIKRGDRDSLDLIKPLWEKLNRIHQGSSLHFKERYEKMDWDKRKSALIEKSGKIMIDYAIDEGEIIGYCISTTDKHDLSTGEIDSILVEKRYRKSGLGRRFMENAIQWLDSEGVKTKRLLVSVGNEKVLDFYRLFNFYPLHIILQKKEKQ